MLDRVIRVMSMRAAVRITMMRACMCAAMPMARVPEARVPGVSYIARMADVSAVPRGISVAVVHEPADCHNAEAYATDGEAGEIEVDHT